MVFDLARLYTCKLYLEKLSNGVDPFTGVDLPSESILNDVYLCRAFRYSGDVLDAVIDNKGVIKPVSPARKKPFYLTDAEREAIRISKKPVGITTVVKNITVVLPADRKGITVFQVTNWLESVGMLETVAEGNGRIRIATPAGNDIGIATVERKTRDDRIYRKNVYDSAAQRFLVDNLENVFAYDEERKQKKA